MKRKYANRADWPRILSKRYVQKRLDEAGFHGYITLLSLDRVKQPLQVEVHGITCCVADDGYLWMQLFPDGGRHTLTVMLDRDRQVKQLYYDIVHSVGTSPDGIPYWDDMYLDVVCFSRGEPHLIDQDELDAALEDGAISKIDYDRAHQEAAALMQSIRDGTNRLMSAWQNHVDDMAARLGQLELEQEQEKVTGDFV